MERDESVSDRGNTATRKRKRVKHACDNCKRKKDRCNGQQPCSLCHRRSHSCQYSNTTAKDLSRHHTHGNEFPVDGTLEAAEAPVPSTARFISDSSGRYNYIGDSASLSFLQSVQLVVASSLGDCSFTSEDIPLSAQKLERPMNVVDGMSAPLVISLENAEYLANEYLTATGCLLDLFDGEDLMEDTRRWIVSPASITSTHRSLILLVLCIGMQMDSAGKASRWDQAAFFERGRQLVYNLSVDEPSLLIVQGFALISMYLLADSRTNSAFVNLGIAIRAAETLGLHKIDRRHFSFKEAAARKRTWRSIRVLDIFLSASTGRPPATSDLDVQTSPDDTEKCTADESFAHATLGLCAIGEKILVDVYKKRSVSTVCVEEISSRIRDWVATLPTMPAALVMQTRSPEHIDLAREMASAHLMGAYYWAVILLTRPFLLFQASMRQAKGSVVATITETCIVAAINGLDLVEDILTHERLPRRLPVVLNSVLNCALAVGVAIFADYDNEFPLSSNLQRAASALRKIGSADSMALQHLQILESFIAATEQYKAQRQRRLLQKKRKQFDMLFGAVDSRFISSKSSKQFQMALQDTCSVPEHCSDVTFDPLWFDAEFATLFPSGLLLGGSNQHTPEPPMSL